MSDHAMGDSGRRRWETIPGWRETWTRTDDGTVWAPVVEAAIVAEELGRGIVDGPRFRGGLATTTFSGNSLLLNRDL